MSRQTKGLFEAPSSQAARRPVGKVLILIAVLLSAARLGAEVLKLLSYADVLIGGGKMLIYGDVRRVDMGDSISNKDVNLPIYTEIPDDGPSDDMIIKLNDGMTILYQGHTYELNQDLITVLLLGIDRSIQDETIAGNGGQSDVILLMGLDTATGKATLLNISREANAQVDVYSADGFKFIETRFEQITLAYAYGNGRETSCENTLRSVSRLLFGLPISSYLALDMDGLKEANETVGGVKLKSLIDIHMPDGAFVREGELVELHGNNLERYIRTRTSELDANAKRMERQKQFLTEFAKLATAKARQKLTYPVDLFSTLSPYVVTDLEIPDVTFLSSTFLKHGANFDFRSIDGSFGKFNGSTVYYLDEVDLFEAVLQVFYRCVD